jgi:WhiB family transcriptional regulator, redox-sensing transcriptional regulator
MIDENKESWRDEANCIKAPLNIFFPEDETGSTSKRKIDRAKTICENCSVQHKCLIYSLNENIDHGVWGGLSSRERKALKRNVDVMDYTSTVKNNDVIDVPIKLVDNKFITPTENRRIP